MKNTLPPAVTTSLPAARRTLPSIEVRDLGIAFRAQLEPLLTAGNPHVLTPRIVSVPIPRRDFVRHTSQWYRSLPSLSPSISHTVFWYPPYSGVTFFLAAHSVAFYSICLSPPNSPFIQARFLLCFVRVIISFSPGGCDSIAFLAFTTAAMRPLCKLLLWGIQPCPAPTTLHLAVASLIQLSSAFCSRFYYTSLLRCRVQFHQAVIRILDPVCLFNPPHLVRRFDFRFAFHTLLFLYRLFAHQG